MSKKQFFIIAIISAVIASGFLFYSLWQKAQKEKSLPKEEEKEEFSVSEKKQILRDLAETGKAEEMTDEEKIQTLEDLSKNQPKAKVRPTFTDEEKRKILESLGQSY